jgi:hypothetical protein
MMSCTHCEEQLSAYLDGIVTAGEKRLVEDHLSTCEQCSLALSELKKTKETLRSLEGIEPPPWFTQEIMSRVREEAKPGKSLLQRLFYPLHIKIPAETLATCLVVVLALFVYKNTEPEIKTIPQPGETATVSPQDQAQEQHEQTRSAPASKELRRKPDGVPKGNTDQERNAVNHSVLDRARAGGPQEKDSPSPAGVPDRQMAERSFEGTESRREAKTSDTAALKKQDAMPAQETAAAPVMKRKEESARPSVGSAAIQETQQAMKTPAAREIQIRSATEPKRVLITVLANNIEIIAKETENLLNRVGAKNINRSTRQPRSISFDAEIPSQKVKELFDGLKSVGDIKEEEIPAMSSEDYLAVRIEVTGNP